MSHTDWFDQLRSAHGRLFLKTFFRQIQIDKRSNAIQSFFDFHLMLTDKKQCSTARWR